MAMDPFLGKAVSSAVQTGMKTGGGFPSAGTSPTESVFKDVMAQMGNQQDMTASMGVPGGDIDPQGEKFRAITAEGFDPLPEHLVTSPQEPSGSHLAMDMLQELNTTGNRMETMFNKLAYNHTTMSMPQMLAMQAHIYLWAQKIEMGVKVASEGVSSLRTVLNTQIQ